jgi:hypothetical protein
MKIQELAKLCELPLSTAYKVKARLWHFKAFRDSCKLAKKLHLKPYITTKEVKAMFGCCTNTALKWMKHFPITMNGNRCVILLIHLHGHK